MSLGKDTNAIVWPRGPSADEDEDDEGPETFKNQKFMRLGMLFHPRLIGGFSTNRVFDYRRDCS